MEMGRHAGDAAGKDLAALGHKLFQEIGIFVIDRFDRDVDPAPGHGAIGAAKSGTAFGGLGLHQIIWFRDEACACAKTDCISFSRAGSASAGFSCSAWSCNAKPVFLKLSLRCT